MLDIQHVDSTTAPGFDANPIVVLPLSVARRLPLRRLLQAGPEPTQHGRDVELVEVHVQQDKLAIASPRVGQRPVEVTNRLDPVSAAGADDLRQFAVVPALDVIERADGKLLHYTTNTL